MGHHYVERDIKMHLRRRSQQQQIQQLDRKVRDQGTELERQISDEAGVRIRIFTALSCP